jgi:hypothetical protein
VRSHRFVGPSGLPKKKITLAFSDPSYRLSPVLLSWLGTPLLWWAPRSWLPSGPNEFGRVTPGFLVVTVLFTGAFPVTFTMLYLLDPCSTPW